ncbi:MAG TPA: MFS transporter [Vicinamibacterales bacterium]|nr:MFS transporter [Vicinamibacterales bacterium]
MNPRTTGPASPRTHVARGSRAFWKINLAVFSAGFSVFLLMYAVQPLLPIFTREFHVNAATSSLALSVTTGCLAVSMLVVGAVAEGWSRKPIMSVSLLAAALLTLLSSAVGEWPTFLFIRAIEGIAIAGLPALAMAYLGEEIHPDDVGVSMGLYVGSGALGGMTGRLLTGLMTDLFSWRPTLAAIGLLGVAAAAIFSVSLPASAQFHPRSLSMRTLLGSYKSHLQDPVILALVMEAGLVLGTLVTVYNYSSFRLLAPPYLLSQTAVGSVFGLYVFGFFSSSLMGFLAHRFSRPLLLRVGLATMALGVAATLLRPLAMVVAGIAFVTIGFFASHSVASSWVGLRAREGKAQASALYLFFYYMGASTAGTIGGFFWTAYAWNGVAAFLAILLVVAFVLAGRFLR